jgi:hypothetical protein
LKRFLLVMMVLAMLGAGVVGGLWYYTGQTGGTQVETWIGKQIVGVLGNYITPKITFTTLDYQAPRTVVITQLALDYDGTPIAEVEELRLELAEIPSRGEPIQIERIDAKAPRLLFRMTDQGFAGWGDFINLPAIKDPESVPTGQRFSDVLVLRHVEITDGECVYEEQGDADRQMTLPGVNFSLDTPPVDGEPGLYALNGALKRGDLFEIAIAARVNLDTHVLKIDELNARVSLDEAGRTTLPPALQRFLETHQANGALTANVSGEIPLDALDQAAAKVHAELHDGRVALHDIVVPIGRVTVDGTMPGAKVAVEIRDAVMMHGENTIGSFERLALSLAGLPRAGDRLTVSQLLLEKPKVAFLRTAEGDWSGWSDIARTASVTTSSEPLANAVADAAPGGLDWSAFAIEDAKVTGAVIAWQSSPDTAPLALDAIAATFSMTPADSTAKTTPPSEVGAAKSNASQRIELRVNRPPLFESTFVGRLSPNDFVVDVQEFHASASLGESQYATLPEALQTEARGHDVAGQLSASFTGHLPLREVDQARGEGSLELRDAIVSTGEKVFPVDMLRASVQLDGGSAPFEFEGQTLSGELSGSGMVQLASPRSFDVAWNVADIELKETLRAAGEQVPGNALKLPKYSGKLSTQGNAQGELATLPESISGEGQLTVREARLMNVPIIGNIVELLEAARMGKVVKATDSADVEFNLTGEGIQIVKGKVVTAFALMRGSGLIGYDTSLDLLVSAGAFEKLKDDLGRVGEMLNAVSDRVIKYTVKGTINEPKLGVSAFGSGT